MTTGIRSDASGTYGALTLGGVDKVIVGNNGIQAGSYAPDSITAAELAPGALNEQLNATGSAPTYACRAWVNFNGTGTVAIRASGNVSSITDNGVGKYTVNFINVLTDAQYAVAGASKTKDDAAGPGSNNSFGPYGATTSSVSVLSIDAASGSLRDSTLMYVVIFR